MSHSAIVHVFAVVLTCSTSAFGQAVDPRGPVANYSDMQVTKDGVALLHGAVASESENSTSRTMPWNATWIAPPASANSNASVIRLRKVVELPAGSKMAEAVALVTADPFYRLWVNGHLVSRGPDDAGSDYSPRERWSHQWLANQVNIGRYLHGGQNVVAAEVFANHRNLSRGTTGFAFRASIKLRERSIPVLVESGADWLAKNVGAYSNGPVSNGNATESEALLYDARKDEPDWQEIGFATTSWSPARVLDNIWGPITVSRLPPMMEATIPFVKVSGLNGSPAPDLLPTSRAHASGESRHSLTLPGNGAFVIEYERVLSGYVSLVLKGTPGTVVSVWSRELMSDAPGRRPFVITLGNEVTFFESPALESFSSLEVDVSNASAPVHFQDIRANFVSQPVTYRGSFASSSESLNALWKAARWQTQICLQNRFLDSPDHQEPIGDPGDYLIEAKVADYAFGPVALTPQFLRQFAEILDSWMVNHPNGSPNFHTSYSLLWLQTLLEYYDETGDVSLATELAPTAYRLLARYEQWIGRNGILSDAPNYLFMDWVTIGGFPTHHPPAVIGQGYLTAFYYRGLADGQRLAEMTRDTARITQYMKQRSKLRIAFNNELWDAQIGLYRDGKPFLNHNPTSPDFLPPDQNIETHSPHVNALAVLYDLAPPERRAPILARVFAPRDVASKNPAGDQETDDSGFLNVQPYFMHFIFAAEAHAGVFAQYAPGQLSRWVVNPQTKTFEEMWTRGDWSHGWGATPLIQMSSHLLGVSARSPGYTNVLLAPIPLGLSFATGTVPTPKGDVHVSWTRDDKQFTYDVSLPSAMNGSLNLADIAGTHSVLVTVDRNPSVPYTGPIDLPPGSHRIVVLSNIRRAP